MPKISKSNQHVVTGGGSNTFPPGSASVTIDGVVYEPGASIPVEVRVPKWLVEQGYVEVAGSAPDVEPEPDPIPEPEPVLDIEVDE